MAKTEKKSKILKSSKAKSLGKLYNEEGKDDFKRPIWPSVKVIFLSILLGIFIGGGLALFVSQKTINSLEARLNQLTQNRVKKSLEQKVLGLIRYTPQKRPIIAKVKDVEVIKNIPLYQLAKNGDKVIVYKDITVIYDEKQNKIVSAVPQDLLKLTSKINFNKKDNDTNQEQAIAENVSESKNRVEEKGIDSLKIKKENEQVKDKQVIKPEDVTVEVRNGTNIAGLAGKNAKIIRDEFGFKTTAVNAAKNNYKQSLIVDLSGGELSEQVNKIAEKLSITTIKNNLPEGEKGTDSKIVVILGK